MNFSKQIIIEFCATTVVLIGFTAVIGKIFGFHFLTNWGHGFDISLPACAGFFMTGIAIRCLLHKET